MQFKNSLSIKIAWFTQTNLQFQIHALPEPRNLETNKNVHLADQTESALQLDLQCVWGVVTGQSLTLTFQLVVRINQSQRIRIN